MALAGREQLGGDASAAKSLATAQPRAVASRPHARRWPWTTTHVQAFARDHSATANDRQRTDFRRLLRHRLDADVLLAGPAQSREPQLSRWGCEGLNSLAIAWSPRVRPRSAPTVAAQMRQNPPQSLTPNWGDHEPKRLQACRRMLTRPPQHLTPPDFTVCVDRLSAANRAAGSARSEWCEWVSRWIEAAALALAEAHPPRPRGHRRTGARA